MNSFSLFMRNAGKTAGKFIENHLPDICLILGIGAGGYAVYSSAKETPKATIYISNKKKELKTEKLPAVEILKTAWKCYPKTIVSEVLSASLLIAGNRVCHSYNASLATALALSEGALVKYRDEVANVIGEKAEKELAKPIIQEKDNGYSFEPHLDMDDMIWCKDYYTGKCFWCSRTKLYKAVAKLNAKLVSEMRVSYNEFLDLIDVDICGFGQEHEWDVMDGAVEIIFEEGEIDTRTKKTPTVIRFNRDPRKFSSVF